MNDLISRQAAIDAVRTALFPRMHTADDAEVAIMTVPSAQQWISCKERLPDTQDWVNITVFDESGDSKFWYPTVGWHLSDGTWIVDNEAMSEYALRRVVAWMPLPEPWEGGAE